jgi:hypothetical protein
MTTAARSVTAVEERVGEALARAEWTAALDLLRSEREQRPLTPAELDMLGRAAYGAGEFELAITAWEQAYAECQLVGDDAGAGTAAVTVAVYLLIDTGLMAPIRGWLGRADRLLERQEESPAHALAAMVHAYERFLCGDTASARPWAQRAIDLGIRQRVGVAAALGRVATARLLILEGDVDDGLALLDEAAVSVVSGELDALAVGMVYCELICAMQGLAQYDRAEQWTEAMDLWRAGTAYGAFNGRCRVHRAEMLRLHGSCAEAEREALAACRELRPWMRREYGWPLTELGTIRLRRGDLAGAEEAFLAADEHGWDPQPGLALLRLAQGDVAAAAALIGEALAHPRPVPWKERPPHGALRRAPLLAAQVEISLAADDLACARAAATELSGIGDTFRSQALQAAAALARGRVALAEGDPTAAIQECGASLAGWTDVDAPYELAATRSVLARAHRATGCAERARLEERAARAILERLRVPAATSSTDPPQQAPAGAENVFRLDGDTRTVTFAGRTVLLQNLKGMHYLARLLAAPDREFHVLDLVADVAGTGPRSGEGDVGPALDAEARAAYKRRLAEIDADIDEATSLGDDERLAGARADRDYLVRELARAYGVGGRHRLVGATSERARASVTRALRYAIARIAEHHPQLADHLARTVSTGTYCSYNPDPRLPVRWQV